MRRGCILLCIKNVVFQSHLVAIASSSCFVGENAALQLLSTPLLSPATLHFCLSVAVVWGLLMWGLQQGEQQAWKSAAQTYEQNYLYNLELLKWQSFSCPSLSRHLLEPLTDLARWVVTIILWKEPNVTSQIVLSLPLVSSLFPPVELCRAEWLCDSDNHTVVCTALRRSLCVCTRVGWQQPL